MTTHRSTPELAVEAAGLAKVLGKTHAVDGLDLVVRTGSIYGLLGPNGAGKTTTIRILATLLRPDGGAARVFGHDVVDEAGEVCSRVSLTGQFASVDEDLTGRENLVLLGRLLGHTRASARGRADELLGAFGLDAAATRRVRTYSGGMRRRLDIAASIVVTPDLLFLDEPTTALDPHSRNQVWQIVRSLATRGTTVLLTTQYLDEADQLADRIAVIDHGKMIAEGSPAELKASVGVGTLRVGLRNPEDRPRAAQLLTRALAVEARLEAEPTAISTPVSDTALVGEALAVLARSEVPITTVALGQPRLDEVFLALTGPAAGIATTSEEEAA